MFEDRSAYKNLLLMICFTFRKHQNKIHAKDFRKYKRLPTWMTRKKVSMKNIGVKIY